MAQKASVRPWSNRSRIPGLITGVYARGKALGWPERGQQCPYWSGTECWGVWVWNDWLPEKTYWISSFKPWLPCHGYTVTGLWSSSQLQQCSHVQLQGKIHSDDDSIQKVDIDLWCLARRSKRQPSHRDTQPEHFTVQALTLNIH